jgi:DNA-3-methyladenine glycosylase
MNKAAVKIPPSFYRNMDVVAICRSLIGKVLVSHMEGVKTSGIIVEAEAYRGPDDRACHAYANRRTPRTEVMYNVGGVAYIYICYGIHHLFNVVTGPRDHAHAVLIRALEPLEGIETMMERRQMFKPGDPRLTRGPGALSVALGLNSSFSGHSLIDRQSMIYIEDRSIRFPEDRIAAGIRIGVESAGESAKWPWRFYVRNHPNVSAKRT